MVNKMDGFETITFHKSRRIAYISLNRPKVLNAYSVRMRDELYQVLEAVREDSEVGVVIITGERRAFCAGADLTEFGTAPSVTIARQVRWERDIWGLFLSIPQPLIAAVHGYCLGSGMEIALLCDIRIASDDAVFGLPELGLGMIPAAGGTQTLPRAVGIPRALEMLLTQRRISAHEAMELGLLNKVVVREALVQEAESLAHHLLALDQGVVRAAKAAVWKGADRPLGEAIDLEGRLAALALMNK